MKILNQSEVISITGSSGADSTRASALPAEERRGLLKVSSGINIAENYIIAREGKINMKEQQFKQ